MKEFSFLAKIAIRYGLLAGILGTGLLIGMYYLGVHPVLVSPFLDIRILLFGVFIVFCLREFRDVHQQGVLYFWQGLFGSGVLVVIAALIASLGLLVFASLEKHFVTLYIKSMTQYLKSFPAEDIERMIGKKSYESNLKALPATNAMDLFETYLGQGLVIGFFISIIISVILRRQPKN